MRWVGLKYWLIFQRFGDLLIKADILRGLNHSFCSLSVSHLANNLNLFCSTGNGKSMISFSPVLPLIFPTLSKWKKREKELKTWVPASPVDILGLLWKLEKEIWKLCVFWVNLSYIWCYAQARYFDVDNWFLLLHSFLSLSMVCIASQVFMMFQEGFLIVHFLPLQLSGQAEMPESWLWNVTVKDRSAQILPCFSEQCVIEEVNL